MRLEKLRQLKTSLEAFIEAGNDIDNKLLHAGKGDIELVNWDALIVLDKALVKELEAAEKDAERYKGARHFNPWID